MLNANDYAGVIKMLDDLERTRTAKLNIVPYAPGYIPKSTVGDLFKLPGYANGGSFPAYQPMVVGEQGPELFIPSGAGNIIPNSRMSSAGGNTYITNNITAMDSKSVSQVFAENRMSLLGTVEQARRELPMRTR
jgi:hypothetical protein